MRDRASETEITEYQRGLFLKKPGAGFFSRILFYSYHRWITIRLGGSDTTALRRVVLLFVAFLFLSITLISATPADFWMVYRDSGYEQPSIIYAESEKGQDVPIAEFYRYSRNVIPLAGKGDRGTGMKAARAFIATEDNNFYYHPGIDPQGILRAAMVNLIAGRIREGASTITQQVARLRFLNRKRSYMRKAREAFLSLLLEAKYSKPKILEIYLNEVPLGHGTNGVEAAAKFYFGKSVFDLNWGEAAVLASLTTRPQQFSPLRNINESRQKVRVVYHKLVESGELDVHGAERSYQDLERDFYATLNRSPNDSAFNQRLNLHPYVSEYVKTLLPEKYRRRLYTGGLRIYTTIVEEHQAAAEETFIPYLREQTKLRARPPFKHFDAFDDTYGHIYPLLRDLFGLPNFREGMTRNERDFFLSYTSQLKNAAMLLSLLSGESNVQEAMEEFQTNLSSGTIKGVVADDDQSVEGSLVSIRPNSGEITAVVGGSGFSSSNQLLRFSMSRRQPGSSFKPFLYAAGIDYTGKNPDTDHPLTAATIVDDSPLQFVGRDLSEYSPENYSGGYEGPMRLRKALALSKNMVAVRVYDMLGPSVVNPMAEKILQFDEATPRRHLPREASIALGSYGVTSLEMARAYAVFASDGREVHPYLIRYITDDRGRVLVDFRKKGAGQPGRQVIEPGTAEIITSMLRDVIKEGTGQAAALPGREVAGKTGTTNRETDAWFVGYTPSLVTAVHIGYDIVRSLGHGGTGGTLVAPVWGRYMNRALSDEREGHFTFPGSNVEHRSVCKISGKLPGASCKDLLDELFLPGTAPKEICEDHARNNANPFQSPSIKKNEGVFSEEDF